MAFRIRVLAFNEGELIPARYTSDGENVSPAIEWDDLPSGTRSLALLVDDPDAPTGTWTHWLLWDIPATRSGVAEGFLPGLLGTSGINDFGNPGYGGPAPPTGHGVHRYRFRLFALDTPRLMLREGGDRHKFDKALFGHDLGEACYVGKYERKVMATMVP